MSVGLWASCLSCEAGCYFCRSIKRVKLEGDFKAKAVKRVRYVPLK